jgi:hypothetical protein
MFKVAHAGMAPGAPLDPMPQNPASGDEGFGIVSRRAERTVRNGEC